MTTIKRRLIALFAVLAVVAVGGCSASNKLTGTWEVTDVKVDGVTSSAEEMGELKDLDLQFRLTFQEDGILVLDFLGELAEGTWSQDGATVTMQVADEDEPLVGELDGEKLILEAEGTRLVFEKTDSESTSIVEDEGQASGPAGDWDLVNADTGGESLGEGQIAEFVDEGIEFRMTLNPDGTVAFAMFGEEGGGDWQEEDGTLTVTLEGDRDEEYVGAVDGDSLTLQAGDTEYTFERAGTVSDLDAGLDEGLDGGLSSSSADAGEVAAFGQTHEFQDGLAVTVAPPEEFEIEKSLAGSYDLATTTPLYFEVTVTNGSDAKLDALMFTSELLSDGKPAEAIHLGEEVDLQTPSVELLPGKTLTYNVGFAVQDIGDLDLMWQADWDRDLVHFTD